MSVDKYSKSLGEEWWWGEDSKELRKKSYSYVMLVIEKIWELFLESFLVSWFSWSWEFTYITEVNKFIDIYQSDQL